MMEEFEYRGVWWLPNKPENKLSGTIKFHPIDGAQLEIIGSGFGIVADNIILGQIEKGRSVTLHAPWQRGMRSAVGYRGEAYDIELVIIGCHFEKEDEIIFDTLTIEYIHLQEWLGRTGFSGGFDTYLTDRPNREVKYDFPEDFSIQLEDFKLTFSHSLRYEPTIVNKRTFEFQAKQTTFVKITPSIPLSFFDYHSSILYHLQNFFCFGIASTILPLRMLGTNQNLTVQVAQAAWDTCDADIFYVAKGVESQQNKRLNPWNMLFTYDDIADNIQSYLQNWFTKSKRLKPVFALYFGFYYISTMYTHLEFLSLVQALETYHRRMYEGVYMSPNDYETIRKSLTEAIPENVQTPHRKKLENMITYGYEYSLPKRLKNILKDVLEPYQETVHRLVGKPKDFAKKVADMRNYLTHYSEELDGSSITDHQKQYELANQLRLLLQLCFFHELGFSPDLVEKLMSENQKFKRFSTG